MILIAWYGFRMEAYLAQLYIWTPEVYGHKFRKSSENFEVKSVLWKSKNESTTNIEPIIGILYRYRSTLSIFGQYRYRYR